MTTDTSDTSHLFFARKLANNDLAQRTQTLTNLSKFFTKSVGLMKEEDVLKIWMGLFYAMWMSDKPLVQRELSEAISKLIHSHSNPDNAILFIKTFYITMQRQFPLIDRLRHDKFLKFVRFFVHHSFKFLKEQNYSSEIIQKYIDAQTDIWGVDDAQEIQLHVCDLFFDELFFACGEDIPSAAIFQLSSLFADNLVQTNHTILKARLFEVLKALIAGSAYCTPKLAPKTRRGIDTDKDLFPDVAFVNVKLDELVDWFMKRASTTDPILNRELLYQLKDEAMKKQKAEPGFKVLPRTSIMKTVAEAETNEFKRLMEEHRKAQAALPKEKELSKKESKKKVKEQATKVNGQEVNNVDKEEEPKKGKRTRAEVPAPVAEPEETPQNKTKKAKVDTTTTVVTTKKQKKNANGDIVGKSEETVETVVVEDAAAKKTEITTTTTTKSVKKTPVKKGAKKAAVEVEEEAEEVVEPVVEKKGKGKKQAPVVEEEAEEEAPVETKKKTPQKKATPVPAPAATNGKKRKAAEADVEEEAPAQNGSPAVTKKGKKATPKAETVTPQKAEAPSTSTPPSSGKKSVRFSKNNHVKEFDKLEKIAETPLTPSSTKPKSVLNTPPAKPKVVKKK